MGPIACRLNAFFFNMARWIIKPVFVTFGTLLLVYVVLVSQNNSSVIPRFNRLNAFDTGLDPDLLSENYTNEEVLLFDHPKEALSKLIDSARAECHEDNLQEKVDIRINGQNVTFSPSFNVANSLVDKLNVHIVFHSHIDPGWLRTFDEYYNEKVRYILENAINFLSAYSDSRFIWSEMSFLHTFYTKSSKEVQQKIQKLIENGQLELCGGAWVMTDEATPYFWATIDNIIEGQRFILEELNATAKSSWSVDPFGHGASNPYLLSLTEIENLVVGRLDKHVKEQLIKQGSLLFKWAQPWNSGAEENVPLISSLPRTYYTTVDACGPDSSVCCQFDFGNTRSICGSRAQINNNTVDKYATMLVNQYYKLQPYYHTKNLLVAIGDDFFFSEPRDFIENYKNYRALIDHINSNPHFKMNIKFSTVNEYFKELRADTKSFSILRGDFFPYTEDRNGGYPYWTGYFVHRPYFKRLERIIQGKLRRLDIIRSLLGRIDNYESLQLHRRNLALVQHHDAITGTSKPHVMKDYTTRLLAAESAFKQLEADVLGGLDYVDFIDGTKTLLFDSKTQVHRITVFNQRTSTDVQRVFILVNRPNVVISTPNGTVIDAQIFPHMDLKTWTQSQTTFELIFYVRVPALGTRRLLLYLKNETSPTAHLSNNKNSNVSLVSTENFGDNLNDNLEGGEKEGFSVDCGNFTLYFDDFGLLKSFKRDDDLDKNEEIKLRMHYGYYPDSGGAYVFVPEEHQKTATLKPTTPDPVVVIKPETVRIYSKLQFSDPSKYELYQFIEIPRKQSSKSIEIRVELISSPVFLEGKTFMMNLETGIDNDDELLTDVNGLYLTQRVMNGAVNEAGNFYPAPSSSVIEDHAERLTVLFGQPTGVTTSNRGHLGFFVDRNMRGSDGKGLDYGDAYTNETTHLHYRIIIEKRDVAHAHKTIYLSRHSHESLEELLHPSSIYQTRNAKVLQGVLWLCNIQLVNIRHLSKPTGTILLILRLIDFDCSVLDKQCVNNDDKLLFNTLTQLFPGKKPHFTSLTGAQSGPEITETSLNERLMPFQIVSFKYE